MGQLLFDIYNTEASQSLPLVQKKTEEIGSFYNYSVIMFNIVSLPKFDESIRNEKNRTYYPSVKVSENNDIVEFNY